MQTEPNTYPYRDFERLLSNKFLVKLASKTLEGNVQVVQYLNVQAAAHFIAINKTIFILYNTSEAYDFYDNIKKPPAGSVQYDLPIDCKRLAEPVDLQYRLMTCDFFYSTKLYRMSSWMKVLSESILNDGRVSVLYCRMPLGVGEKPQKYYLVIGRLVFTHWRVEPLIKLEAAINDGIATYWRPELTGTMNYIPVYTVNDYTNHHRRYIVPSGLFKTSALPDGTTASVYTLTQKKTRFYLRAWDKIYSFASLSDLEIILDKLTKSAPPAQAVPDQDRLLKHAQVIAARRNRYINADMYYWNGQAQIKVSGTGSLVLLNPGAL